MARAEPKWQVVYNEGSGSQVSSVGHEPPQVATAKVVLRYGAGRRKHCRDGQSGLWE